jgi:hypothetical protein
MKDMWREIQYVVLVGTSTSKFFITAGQNEGREGA